MIKLVLFLAISLAGTWPADCYNSPCPWAITTKSNTPVYAANCDSNTCHLSQNPVRHLPEGWSVHFERDVTVGSGEYLIVLYDVPGPGRVINQYGAIPIGDLKPDNC